MPPHSTDRAALRARAAAASGLATRLATTIGTQPAAVWIHAAALARHAGESGLTAPAPRDPRRAVEQLAAAHPALAPLGQHALAVMDGAPLNSAGTDAIAAFLDTNPTPAAPERPDGHALGDLYQALSAEARSARALCQTPAPVARLLLELAYDPAAEQFGRTGLQMIDPACGTGHILIEALIHGYATSPASGPAAIEAAADAVHGVDLDPYAAAVARYRLVAAAAGMLRAHRRGDGSAASVPHGWPVHVAAADALLDSAEPLLQRGRYHAIVANPPYITVKNPAVNAAIRAAWPAVCSGRYSMALPFHALMNALAVPGGFIAQLTANSFMKREFGRRYVERFLAATDLTWVIDTSGAYIPGHGTPTVILVNRNRPPSAAPVHSVLGVRGEPSAPADMASGLVWRAIVDAVHQVLAYERLERALNRHTAAPTVPDPAEQSAPARRAAAVQQVLFDLGDAA